MSPPCLAASKRDRGLSRDRRVSRHAVSRAAAAAPQRDRGGSRGLLVIRHAFSRAGAAAPQRGVRAGRRVRSESGQASVELVILAPLLVAVVLAAAQLLAAGAAGELADHAAEAGAMALLQGADPAAAARDAVPGWSRERMTVRIDGRRVRVRMSPPSPFPGLGGKLASERSADAGPRAR